MSQQVKVYRKLSLEHPYALMQVASNSLPMPITIGTPTISIYTTSNSTNTSTSIEPFYLKSVMTGAAGVGGRARFHMYTNVSLGGWSNALKGYAEYGTSGRTAGLGSAICAEMYISNVDIVGAGGGYFPLEIEYVAGGSSLVSAGALTGNHVGFIWMEASGDTDGDFDDNGYIMHIKGLTAGSGHMFQTGANTGTIAGSLKIGINDTIYYWPLWSNQVQA